MEKFIKAASSDLLADAVPESLKNMLLVMETAGIFAPAPTPADSKNFTPILDLTWEKLDTFLPQLMPDLFGQRQKEVAPAGVKPQETPASPAKSDKSQISEKVPRNTEAPPVVEKPVAPAEPVAPLESVAPTESVATAKQVIQESVDQ